MVELLTCMYWIQLVWQILEFWCRQNIVATLALFIFLMLTVTMTIAVRKVRRKTIKETTRSKKCWLPCGKIQLPNHVRLHFKFVMLPCWYIIKTKFYLVRFCQTICLGFDNASTLPAFPQWFVQNTKYNFLKFVSVFENSPI